MYNACGIWSENDKKIINTHKLCMGNLKPLNEGILVFVEATTAFAGQM